MVMNKELNLSVHKGFRVTAYENKLIEAAARQGFKLSKTARLVIVREAKRFLKGK